MRETAVGERHYGSKRGLRGPGIPVQRLRLSKKRKFNVFNLPGRKLKLETTTDVSLATPRDQRTMKTTQRFQVDENRFYLRKSRRKRFEGEGKDGYRVAETKIHQKRRTKIGQIHATQDPF